MWFLFMLTLLLMLLSTMVKASLFG